MAKTINIAINTASLVGPYQLHYLLCFIIIIIIITDVVLGCTLVCYMPHKKDFVNLQKIIPTAICPYDCLQNDVLEYQAEVPRFWSVVTSMLGLQRSQTS